uniref:Uncharacterized protein n=1 Tax=Sorghum bicolor TaxID=4558 RepID=C6JRY4_SORBI
MHLISALSLLLTLLNATTGYRRRRQKCPAFRFVTRVVKIPPESITRIKDATGQICSTFDVVTAVVFKCCVLDMVLPDDAEVQHAVHLLHGVLIREASLQEVASGMREAKEALTSRLTGLLFGHSTSPQAWQEEDRSWAALPVVPAWSGDPAAGVAGGGGRRRSCDDGPEIVPSFLRSDSRCGRRRIVPGLPFPSFLLGPIRQQAWLEEEDAGDRATTGRRSGETVLSFLFSTFDRSDTELKLGVF